MIEERFYPKMRVYLEALQIHMLKWIDNEVHVRRLMKARKDPQLNLFAHTDLYKSNKRRILPCRANEAPKQRP